MFGRGVMLKVVSSRVAGKGRVVARFENIDDRTEAERWTNVELFAAPIDDPNALWVHDLIGQQVVDQRGIVRGECVMILANPAAEILELDSGSLVPSNFIVSVSDGVISVEVPEGLFELNDA
jgi:16S rRNA processing protein RimM